MSFSRQFRKSQLAKAATSLQKQNRRLQTRMARMDALPILGVMVLCGISFVGGYLIHTTVCAVPSPRTPVHQVQATQPSVPKKFGGAPIVPACVAIQLLAIDDGENKDTMPAMAVLPCPGTSPLSHPSLPRGRG
jgi:hypothetical protein